MKLLILFFACTFLFDKVYAFPEMIRHGYTSCTSCHVSPTGGGVLTPYGRELSKEILSTWGKENEGQLLNGKISPPKWLRIGGDIRQMQLFRKTETVEEAKSFLMQTDIETAVILRKFILDVSGGVQQAENSDPPKNAFISRRHYVGYIFNDNISIRGGRFYPAYGINIPEHASVIKKGLGWDQGQETYNFELNYLKDDFEVFLTGLFGRPDQTKEDTNKGFVISPSYAVTDKIKIGIDYLKGNSKQFERNLYGFHVLAAYNEKLYLLSEADWQKIGYSPSFNQTHGFFSYNKIGYELIQGLHLNFTFEFAQSDLNNSNSIIRALGPGLQFFPRPHFELNALLSKQQILAVSRNYGDFAYIILHYYF